MLRFTAEDCRKKRKEETTEFTKQVEQESIDMANEIAEKVYNTKGCNETTVHIVATAEEFQEAVVSKTIALLNEAGFNVFPLPYNGDHIKVSI